MSTKVSIIITTCNRAEELGKTLMSLGKVLVPKDLPTEVLVVDNASTDNTAEVIRNYRLPQLSVRYLYEPQRGQSNARNSGIANTTGDVILFTDDDVRVPQDWVTGMSAPILEGRADATVGGVAIAPHLERSWMTRFHLGWLAITMNLDFDSPGTLVGANMAFSRKVFEIIPGFDSKLGPGALGFADDTLFGKQTLIAGMRIAGCPDIKVEHHFVPERLTRQSLLASAMARGRSQAYFDYHWKHENVRKPRIGFVAAWLRLAKWRLRNLSSLRTSEGCHATELNLVRQISYFRQYREEARLPRNYAKHGLLKLHAD